MQVVKLTNDTLNVNLSSHEVTDLIDKGNFEGGKKERFWTLDPIDGTKGFLRGGQYAVGLALIENGIVQMSFLACPNLPIPGSDSNEKGRLFTATRGQGAFSRSFSNEDENKISVSKSNQLPTMRFCESFESGHSSHTDSEKIAQLLNISTTPVRLDSMCKYAIVSSGEADIYLRLPVSMEYEEKIWDHAPGSLLLTESGGSICDCFGKPLDFGQGRTLKSKGVIASNGTVHNEILEAVQKILK